jgi:hypothetical protein
MADGTHMKDLHKHEGREWGYGSLQSVEGPAPFHFLRFYLIYIRGSIY